MGKTYYSVIVFTFTCSFMVPIILARFVKNETNNEQDDGYMTNEKICYSNRCDSGIDSIRRDLHECVANNAIDSTRRDLHECVANNKIDSTRRDLHECVANNAIDLTQRDLHECVANNKIDSTWRDLHECVANNAIDSTRRDLQECVANNAIDSTRRDLQECVANNTIDSTRRDLQGCVASNSIDKCWRCKPDWAENRQALAQCACGFAKGTTGGQGGEIYTVVDPSDDDPANPKEGTLRFGVIQNRPLWIVFEKDMIISLKLELRMNNDKTIDGRGAKVEIANGAGFVLASVSNVIIHGIHIHDIIQTEGGLVKCKEDKPARASNKMTDGDAMCIFGCSKIWIDHCTLSKCVDGLIDVTVGSTAIMISNCKFSDHDKVILLGADDTHTQDKEMQATVAYNHFEATCVQRLPRCRHGFFQVVNNNYDGWGIYAIGGSGNPTILSQGNKFKAPDRACKKNVLQRCEAPESEWMKWNWRTEKDVLENGAIFVPSGCDPTLTAEQQGLMIVAEPGESAPELTNAAGALACLAGQPC